MEETVETQLEQVSAIIEIAAEFAISYGLQILGALVILMIGLKFAGFVGRRITKMCARKELDVTLSRFAGSAVKILLVAIVVIILTRPFTVGNMIMVQDVSGVVDEVSLSTTTLIGEDQEKITIPNRKVVGEILVNSAAHRIVESQIVIAADNDPEIAITAIAKALENYPGMAEGSDLQGGIHDFSYGGIILGLRYWVSSSRYFLTRFEVNRAAYAALKGVGIQLMSGGRVAILAEPPAS
jgi:small conductance mechanosensitive channel